MDQSDPIETTTSATPEPVPTQDQASAPSQDTAIPQGEPAEGATDSTPELKGLEDAPKAEEAKEEAKAEEEKEAKTHDSVGAPEGDYDYSNVKMPDGMEMDTDLVNTFSKVAKELDLSNAAASKIVAEVGPAFQAAQKAQIERMGEQWLKDAYADPEMGGAKWESTMADANTAFNRFANPQVRQLLVNTGLSKNADVIRMFRDIGRATGGDSVVTGKATPAKVDPLSYVYNNSNMQ